MCVGGVVFLGLGGFVLVLLVGVCFFLEIAIAILLFRGSVIQMRTE